MTMMSGVVICDVAAVWVLQKVLKQYKISSVVTRLEPPDVVASTKPPYVVQPLDPAATQVRLLWHTDTTTTGRRIQTVLEGAQAALTALHFMGHVRVAETREGENT